MADKPYDLVKVFAPKVPGNIQYCPIGSRVYLRNPGPDSDYDFMFYPYDRSHVVEHLDKIGVDYKEGLSGSIKFSVCLSDLRSDEINFCFVKDFDIWRKATKVMRAIFEQPSLDGTSMSKEERMVLFKRIVDELGGEGVLFPKYYS